MKDIVFALINNKPTQENDSSTRMRELTLAWSRYGYHGDLIESDSIDSVLTAAAKTAARFCLVQSAGHVIDEQWYLSHWQREGFYQGINRLMSQSDFLVAGEWEESDRACIGLKTDCFLVNLDQYRTLGHPKFGHADGVVRTVKGARLFTTSGKQQTLLQANENPNDKRELNMIADLQGWNFIQSSFAHSLPVLRFGNAINNCRFNLADQSDNSTFTQLVGQDVLNAQRLTGLTTDQSTFIERIQKQFNDAQKGAFLFNIEPYDDLIQKPHSVPLDALFSVAAGFKPYRILQSQGFHKNTEVVLFDYSLKALEVRRFIVENWDGIDFPAFVRSVFKAFPQEDVFYQLWYQATPDTLDWDDMEHMWQQELKKWGGAEAFQHHWTQCRALPHKYLHCDLLQDRESLMQELSQHKTSYIWWSNAFFTIFSHWHYRPDERKAHYFDWVTELSKVAPHCQINGADHNNMAVNGLSAEQYFTQFNQESCDELTPQRIHNIEIQF